MNKTTKYLLEANKRGYSVSYSGQVLNPKGKQMKPFKSKANYFNFRIRINKEQYSIPVHRLQGYQKYGNEIFKKELQVRHLNGDSLDNSHTNISIGTLSENAMDKTPETRFRTALNASRACQNKKRSYSERCEIYLALMSNVSYNKIREKYNVAKGTLSFMKNNSLEYKEFIKN